MMYSVPMSLWLVDKSQRIIYMIIGISPNIDVDAMIIMGSEFISFVWYFWFIFLLVNRMLNEIFR